MADSYCWFRVRADGRDTAELMLRLQAQTLPQWAASSAGCWGIWQGLFGIASNELLVMAAAAGDRALAPLAAALPAGAALADALELRATVRPRSVAPPAERDGLFVFRLFDVGPADCDEIVSLSRRAWETFETSEAYASRPLGLFRPRVDATDDARPARMLLLTWYDGFASWEASRTPAQAARDNFRRRHALTLGTVAYATRRVG